MSRLMAYFAALVIVIAAGLIHGERSGRWLVTLAVEDAVARLRLVPDAWGDWQGTDQTLDARQLEIGEVAGYLSREYVNRRDGRRFQVLVVCGRPGPIAVHTPDVCYDAAGYDATTLPSSQSLALSDTTQAEVRGALFQSRRADNPEALRILWAWNAGDRWRATENPRVVFASGRALYKVYILHREWAGAADDGVRATREFLGEFLPMLGRSLALGAKSTVTNPPSSS